MKKGRRVILLICLLALLTECIQKPAALEDNSMANVKQLKVESTAFADNEPIPDKYTCNGNDTSPPLMVTGIPNGTKSLALVVEDPDAPSGLWIHWLVWNMPVASELKEDNVPAGALQGTTSEGSTGYHGPCPPSGTHRYMFKAYALDTLFTLSSKSKKPDLDKAMHGHILAQGTLTGLYSRK